MPQRALPANFAGHERPHSKRRTQRDALEWATRICRRRSARLAVRREAKGKADSQPLDFQRSLV